MQLKVELIVFCRKIALWVWCLVIITTNYYCKARVLCHLLSSCLELCEVHSMEMRISWVNIKGMHFYPCWVACLRLERLNHSPVEWSWMELIFKSILFKALFFCLNQQQVIRDQFILPVFEKSIIANSNRFVFWFLRNYREKER